MSGGPAPRPLLLLRLMVEAGSAAEAAEELRRAAPRIEACAPIARHTVERYWKIPGYWEVALHLRPDGRGPGAYECLLALAETGWTPGGSDGDRWAVWNPAPGMELLTPRVRWAELQWNPLAGGG